MVSHLVLSIPLGLAGRATPFTPSPDSPPLTVRRVFNTLASPTPGKQLYLKFSSQEQALGRIVIKVNEDAGRVGWVFESLVTGRDGFGYRGSRVYATCPQEWLLVGDMLYATPKPPTPPTTDWDPRYSNESPPEVRRMSMSEVEIHELTLHHGHIGVPHTQLIAKESTKAGDVVAVVSDFDLESQIWKLGPQFKICLSDNPRRFGQVIGRVIKGLDVALKMSLVDRTAAEPMERITITDCGVFK